MAKPNRGKVLRELPSRGRGECPICNRDGVKVLYEQEIDGKKVKTCKTCRAASKNSKKKSPAASTT